MQIQFVFLLTLLLIEAPAAAQTFLPTPDVYRALAVISGDSLRGNLSFIAADQLGGRDTPSDGLDLAALYIAAQFRRAGLEPAGDDGYFQTAKMLRITPPGEGFELRLQRGSRSVTFPAVRTTVLSQEKLALARAPVVSAEALAEASRDAKQAAVRGSIVILDGTPQHVRAIAREAAAFHPAAFLEIANDNDNDKGDPAVPRLVDAGEERDVFGGAPRLIVRDAEAAKLLRELKPRQTGLTVSVNLPAATATPVTLRNVAALLRGADAALRSQYVLLTAHYDHLGRNGAGQVCPGANDDGSGTVSVIEIARALKAARVHPRRSILFMTFFGEEEGSLGSRYYTRHPLFPLSQTVADLNLEQVGRTDSSAGPEIGNATLTGFRYSNIARQLQQAGKLTGVKVYETRNDDDYFNRSDNQPFAERGIPAHTIVVAFDFPDYHAAGDVWEKIDYGNMAKVDRMIALGIVMLADNTERPQWNRQNPRAGKYLKAR